jgi:protein-S-isoprenylcysteine O-methyltransferase Ste14
MTLIYGQGATIFFLTFLYVGFLGNVLVPKSLDSGLTGPLGTALLVDVGLLALFAVQHSVMARPAFKRLLTNIVSPAAERSTTSCQQSRLVLLFWQWRRGRRGVGGRAPGRTRCYGGFASAGRVTATFVINHFDLFGLRQTAALPGTTAELLRS